MGYVGLYHKRMTIYIVMTYLAWILSYTDDYLYSNDVFSLDSVIHG
jgi:hypothetical protein